MRFTAEGREVFAATGGKPFDAKLPTLVLLHGAAMDHSVWVLQARYLAHHGWGVLALDLPGHGRSGGAPLARIGDYAVWLWRALTAAGVERAALAGHSMGALIALAAAAHAPERVTALALLAVAFPMTVHPDLLAAAKADDPLAFALMTGWSHGPDARLGGHAVPGLWHAGATAGLLGQARPGVLHADLQAAADYAGGLEDAAKVRAPTLFLVGERDRMTPPAQARQLSAAISGSRTQLVAGAGHMLMAERPDIVTDALATLKRTT